jgi:TonB family protein
MGPAAARVLAKQMPSKAPSAPTFTAEASVIVDTNGEVGSADIVTGTGDEEFDKQWLKSMSDWRFVPAVDEAGQPIQSTVRVLYRNNALAVGAPPGNAVTESQRIERMTCKDFDWEYRFVNDVLSRRFALLDPLLKTPRIMLVAENNPSEAQLETLADRYDDVVSDVAKHCRDNPADALWKGVLKPAMEAALVR